MDRHIKTEAVIIGNYKDSEKYKLITLLSKNLGIIRSFVSVSSKKTNTPKTELFTFGNFMLYYNPIKDSFNLLEESPVFFAENIKKDLSATYAASYFAEITSIFKNDEPDKMYSLLTAALQALDLNTQKSRKVLIDFTWNLLKLNGIIADLRFCPNCDRELDYNEILHFSSTLGSPVCKNCADTDTIVLTPGARRYLLFTFNKTFEESLKVELYNTAEARISSFLLNWISILSPYPLKTLKAGIL